MNEKEFIKKYPNGIMEIPIYYGLEDNGDVLLDEDSMWEEFNNTLIEIRDNLSKDELQKLVEEKIKKDEAI